MARSFSTGREWARIRVSALRILTWLILPFAVLAGRYRLRAKVIKGNPIFFRGDFPDASSSVSHEDRSRWPQAIPATRRGERHYTQLVAAFATPFFRFLAFPLIVIFHRLPGRHANAYHC